MFIKADKKKKLLSFVHREKQTSSIYSEIMASQCLHVYIVNLDKVQGNNCLILQKSVN